MKTTAENLEKKFEAGEEVLDYFDLESPQPLDTEIKRVNIDFPAWMVLRLDMEAKKYGVSRQALVKFLLAQTLDKKAG